MVNLAQEMFDDILEVFLSISHDYVIIVKLHTISEGEIRFLILVK